MTDVLTKPRRVATASAPRTTNSRLPSWWRAILLSIREARPMVIGIFALRYLSGILLAMAVVGTSVATLGRAAAGLIAWVCAVAFVYLLNGTSDVVEDRLNGSQRPIARGELPVRQARRVLGWLAAVSVAFALVCGVRTLVLTVALLGLGYLYSGRKVRLKRRPAAAAAIIVVAGVLTYEAGWTDVTGDRPDLAVLLVALIMALWMGLVGGAAKDFADALGDRAAGCAVGVGRRSDLVRRARCAGSALLLGTAGLIADVYGPSVLRWAAATLIVGALVVAVQCGTSLGARTRSELRRAYRSFMATQYAVHLVLVTCLAVGLVAGPGCGCTRT